MDQPVIPTLPQPQPPIINPETTFTHPPKKSFTWLLISILFFLALVSSFFAWKNYRLKNQLGLVQPTPAPTILPSALPNAAGQVYTNTKYGFLVKYDSNNQPTEIEGTGQQLALISFGTMKNNGFDIEISTGDSLSYYKNQLLDHVTGKIEREESITVDGVAGVKLTFKQVLVTDEQAVSQVIIRKNNRDYVVRSLATDIDQILSTFKFIQAPANDLSLEKLCQSAGGAWLNAFNECEGLVLDASFCQKNNGVFSECLSACRHESPELICNTACMQVCKF